MQGRLTVACVLRRGGVYDENWVYRLKAQVKRHLPIEHKFLCLADRALLDCWQIKLQHNWPGWWSKIELFKLAGPVLYFDLDTAIVGDLTALALEATQSPFTTLRDFYSEKNVGSGVMAWNGSMQHLYTQFAANADALMAKYKTRGDQAFIQDATSNVSRWQDRLPGQIVSYKAHVRAATNIRETGNGSIPSGARVVCLHGRPKFDEMPEADPVRKVWDEAA